MEDENRETFKKKLIKEDLGRMEHLMRAIWAKGGFWMRQNVNTLRGIPRGGRY